MMQPTEYEGAKAKWALLTSKDLIFILKGRKPMQTCWGVMWYDAKLPNDRPDGFLNYFWTGSIDL